MPFLIPIVKLIVQALLRTRTSAICSGLAETMLDHYSPVSIIYGNKVFIHLRVYILSLIITYVYFLEL